MVRLYVHVIFAYVHVCIYADGSVLRCSGFSCRVETVAKCTGDKRRTYAQSAAQIYSHILISLVVVFFRRCTACISNRVLCRQKKNDADPAIALRGRVFGHAAY